MHLSHAAQFLWRQQCVLPKTRKKFSDNLTCLVGRNTKLKMAANFFLPAVAWPKFRLAMVRDYFEGNWVFFAERTPWVHSWATCRIQSELDFEGPNAVPEKVVTATIQVIQKTYLDHCPLDLGEKRKRDLARCIVERSTPRCRITERKDQHDVLSKTGAVIRPKGTIRKNLKKVGVHVTFLYGSFTKEQLVQFRNCVLVNLRKILGERDIEGGENSWDNVLDKVFGGYRMSTARKGMKCEVCTSKLSLVLEPCSACNSLRVCLAKDQGAPYFPDQYMSSRGVVKKVDTKRVKAKDIKYVLKLFTDASVRSVETHPNTKRVMKLWDIPADQKIHMNDENSKYVSVVRGGKKRRVTNQEAKAYKTLKGGAMVRLSHNSATIRSIVTEIQRGFNGTYRQLGQKGELRRDVYYQCKGGNRTVIIETLERFCHRKTARHKQNHIRFFVNLQTGVIYQCCFCDFGYTFRGPTLTKTMLRSLETLIKRTRNKRRLGESLDSEDELVEEPTTVNIMTSTTNSISASSTTNSISVSSTNSARVSQMIRGLERKGGNKCNGNSNTKRHRGGGGARNTLKKQKRFQKLVSDSASKATALNAHSNIVAKTQYERREMEKERVGKGSAVLLDSLDFS